MVSLPTNEIEWFVSSGRSAPYGPKKDLVSFGFWYGHMLSNDQGVLKHEGRTRVYIVRYSSLADIDEVILREIIREALLVDEFRFSDIKRKKRRK